MSVKAQEDVICFVEDFCSGEDVLSSIENCCDHRLDPPGLSYVDQDGCNACPRGKVKLKHFVLVFHVMRSSLPFPP